MYNNDIFAETADAVFMDAWLPEYRNEHFGTSLVQIRNIDLMALVSEIKKNQLATVYEVAIDKILASQQPRINNKRLGLLYRLELCQKWGVHYPGNIHLDMNGKHPGANQKKQIALKFAEHLKAHGRRVDNKYILPLSLSLVLNYFSKIRANLKDIVRKYYFKYKYFK